MLKFKPVYRVLPLMIMSFLTYPVLAQEKTPNQPVRTTITRESHQISSSSHTRTGSLRPTPLILKDVKITLPNGVVIVADNCQVDGESGVIICS